MKYALGVIGLSEGNGHPYSWSAIFNGYDEQHMKSCPFPAIPKYLSEQKFPENFLTELAAVSHIWTQNKVISQQVASSSLIPHVLNNMEDMIGQVDGILLARDDAENHLKIARPFIKAGLPIFIDKPFALSIKEARKMLDSQKYKGQIFTCSSLRYSNDLMLTEEERKRLGTIVFVEGYVPKKWETYGIHILEPIVAQLPDRGTLVGVSPNKLDKKQTVVVKWENYLARLIATGEIPSGISLHFYGTKSNIKKTFKDSFTCFKISLSKFIDAMTSKRNLIKEEELIELVEIIEKGRC